MKDVGIIHQLSLKEDEVLVKKKARKAEPNYYKVGNGTMNKHGIQSINLIQEIVKCSKPAQKVLAWVQEGMVWNSYDESISFIVKVCPESKEDKRTLIEGFKELAEKDLVRRVKRSHYMINPNALVTDYHKQMLLWDTLDNKSKDNEEKKEE